MNKNSKKARRTCSAIMLGALTITLASCSGATNTMESDYASKTYASAGDYTITNGELWDELKWSASSVLETKIDEVIILDEIKSISYVLDKDFSELTEDEKKIIWDVNDLGDDNQVGGDVDDEWENVTDFTSEMFDKVKEQYTKRLVDYVVQDVFNLTFTQTSYWDKLAEIPDTTIKTCIQQYVDGIYTSYQKNTTNDGDSLQDVVEAATNNALKAIKDEKIDDIDVDGSLSNDYNVSGFLTIAQSLTELYYPTYAKELYAYEGTRADADEALEDDDDDDDDTFGYFSHSTFVSKYKSTYINTYGLNLIRVSFASSTEFDNTLRAFGIRIYNKKYYFIKDNALTGYAQYLDGSDRMTYDKYVEYYDDFANSDLTTAKGVIEISDETILPLYIALYNYVYGGYRDEIKISGAFDYTIPSDLQDLRKLTYEIIDDYTATNVTEMYETLVEGLKTYSELEYSADDLADISATIKSYCFDTLQLTVDGKHKDLTDADSEDPVEILSTRYSTAAQSTNSGYSIFYKFGDNFQDLNDENSDIYDARAYKEALYYNSDLTTSEIFLHIQEDTELYTEVYDLLIRDQVSSSDLTSYISDEEENVKVKIYVEAVEISYSTSHSNYATTRIASSNKNLLATITYNGTTYNLPIVGELSKDDENALRWAGTDTVYGVFDELELSNGATTAITLLSNKIIKDTQAYKEVQNDADNYTTYSDYINAVLTNFANGALSSSGYDASIGKYNFLMLYFHDTDIDSIIKNKFYTSLASAKLLTDYSNTSLAELFKTYAEIAYDNYFSLSATRLYVYFDKDGDGEADEIEYTYDEATNTYTINSDSWVFNTTEFDLNGNGTIDANETDVTYEIICKSLIAEVYERISASTDSHTDVLTTLVEEIQGSAKASYSTSITSAENTWAKYKKLGLNVSTEELTTTNSTTEIDFNLKQRLYDYARGYSGTETNKTKTYQYYIADSYPTCYIEPLDLDTVIAPSSTNNEILFSDDGYNLILVTQGSKASSAEFSADDYEDDMYKNFVLYYNEQYVTIDDIYNETDKLNLNQIVLYLIDYAINGSSTLAPDALSSAYSAFLEPIYTRFTAEETQRIILLSFIKASTNSTSDLYDVIKFTNTSYNGTDGILANFIEIYQNSADSYSSIKNDTTGTSESYPDWWETIENLVSKFILVGGNSDED